MDKKSVKRRIIEISNKIRISKDGFNEHCKYNYFEPDSILKALNPLLEEYNLIALFNLVQNNGYYTATLTIEDLDSDEKVILQFDIDKAVIKASNPAQCSGGTATYAKRYLLMNCFNIADNQADLDSSHQDSATIPQETRKHNTHSKLFAMAKKAGITNDQVHGWIEKRFNKTSIKDLTTEEYSILLNSIQKKAEAA